MEIITTGKKGKDLNTLERYHIYEISRENLHITLYLKHCMKFTQNNSAPLCPHPHPLRLIVFKHGRQHTTHSNVHAEEVTS
jgi:hypothetical protein